MNLEEEVLLTVFEKREASASEIARELDAPLEKVFEALKNLGSIGLLVARD